MQNVLLNFNLKVIKAVQSIAGENVNFPNWFAALDDYEKLNIKNNFDIAIIGCGAYGFPLAAYIRTIGKQAIHLGGVTQLLFGIKGHRWDSYTDIPKLYNDKWTRPLESERPQNAAKVDDACYW